MELLTAIDTRSSAARLREPGPSVTQLSRIIAAAERAPDHGRLKPWNFLILAGELREKFATAAALAKRAKLPHLDDAQMAADRQKILRSPCVVVIACTLRQQPKIPDIEQIVAVAAAAQNFFLAAHDLGFGVMWKTGHAAYDANVKACLNLSPKDHIIAIMHLGTRE